MHTSSILHETANDRQLLKKGIEYCHQISFEIIVVYSLGNINLYMQNKPAAENTRPTIPANNIPNFSS